MKCPFGYTDHTPTWRCYVVYGADWLLWHIPETWPLWTMRPLMSAIGLIEWKSATGRPTHV